MKTKNKKTTTDVPRKTALMVLNDVLINKHQLDRVISELEDNEEIQFTLRDRKFFNMLVFGVVRWCRTLDWIIEIHSKTRLKKINPVILNVLRLGMYQIFFLDRVPDSAAVNTSVEMAKDISPPWVIKYVNAVLRNAVRSLPSLAFPLLSVNPSLALSVSRSFPQWQMDRWIVRFGVENCEKLCDALNTVPPITLRCNSLKLSRNELMSVVASETENVYPTVFSPDGVCMVGMKKPIRKMDAFKRGFFQVQDEAAQIVLHLLGPEPGEVILDACAGLGGKTGHIAQEMKNTGQVVAVDRDPQKLLRLQEAMERLGVSNVNTFRHDFMFQMNRFREHRFDRILLDAPCSGIGVIRRNPDIKWNVSSGRLKELGKIQRELLKNVTPLLKTGGHLLYVVCSIEPEECEMVISDFLKTHSNFELNHEFKELPFDVGQFVNTDGIFRTLPHLHDMDGFSAACIKRTR